MERLPPCSQHNPALNSTQNVHQIRSWSSKGSPQSIDIAGWEKFVQIKGKPYEPCQKKLEKKRKKLVQEQIKYLRAWLTANKLVNFLLTWTVWDWMLRTLPAEGKDVSATKGAIP